MAVLAQRAKSIVLPEDLNRFANIALEELAEGKHSAIPAAAIRIQAMEGRMRPPGHRYFQPVVSRSPTSCRDMGGPSKFLKYRNGAGYLI